MALFNAMTSFSRDLEKALKEKEYESLVPFPEPDSKRFADFLDASLGL
jgi:beta-1,4-N-acetylglucosaminyltransferase